MVLSSLVGRRRRRIEKGKTAKTDKKIVADKVVDAVSIASR